MTNVTYTLQGQPESNYWYSDRVQTGRYQGFILTIQEGEVFTTREKDMLPNWVMLGNIKRPSKGFVFDAQGHRYIK